MDGELAARLTMGLVVAIALTLLILEMRRK